MPALPSWLADPLWDQFAALLPPQEVFVPTHPWGCHRRRIGDRIVFDKLVQVLRFGCSYDAIADSTCSATTLRARRDEWIALGVFAALARIAREAYDRIVGLLLDHLAVDGCITKAPGGGECAGPSPVDRRKQGRVVADVAQCGEPPLPREPMWLLCVSERKMNPHPADLRFAARGRDGANKCAGQRLVNVSEGDSRTDHTPRRRLNAVVVLSSANAAEAAPAT